MLTADITEKGFNPLFIGAQPATETKRPRKSSGKSKSFNPLFIGAQPAT